MRLPVVPPVAPMLAKPVAEVPGDPAEYLYEPKWDGFRSILFRDGDEIELGSRKERPMTRYFPELVEAARAELPARCVIDGEIVIATGDRLDFEALQQYYFWVSKDISTLEWMYKPVTLRPLEEWGTALTLTLCNRKCQEIP